MLCTAQVALLGLLPRGTPPKFVPAGGSRFAQPGLFTEALEAVNKALRCGKGGGLLQSGCCRATARAGGVGVMGPAWLRRRQRPGGWHRARCSGS